MKLDRDNFPRYNPEHHLVLTHSSRTQFLNCQKKFSFRNEQGLVPLNEHRETLFLGSLIHECLEIWHSRRDSEAVRLHIDQVARQRHESKHERKAWHYAHAMMNGYVKTYPEEDFEVIDLEGPFVGPLVNPTTNHISPRVMFAGVIDGIVKRADGSVWLLEHKTAGKVDGSYIARIFEDPQIFTYAYYFELLKKIKVQGILYNVLIKPALKQAEAETEIAFEQRKADLIKKNMSGKTNAKRRMAESDEDLRERLQKKCDSPDMFVRQEILIDQRQVEQIQTELWQTAQLYLHVRRSGVWVRNRRYCNQFNRQCGYWDVCSAHPGDEERLIKDMLMYEPAHPELAAFLSPTTPHTTGEIHDHYRSF